MNGRKIFIEGSVIVVSILLAFGIDAMWDEYKERREESEVLAALKTEFESNLADIQTVYTYHTRARESVEEMVRKTAEEIRDLDQARRSEYVMALCNPWSFYPILGTTEALIGAGELDILENRDLRVALTTFRYLVEDSIEDVLYVGRDAERVWIEEVETGGPWTDRNTEIGMSGHVVMAPDFVRAPTAEDILAIRSNAKLMGLVGRCHLNVGYYLAELLRLEDGTKRVLELIEDSQ